MVSFRIVQIVGFLLATVVSNYLAAKAAKAECLALFVLAVAIVGYYTSKIVWLSWSIQAGMTATVFVYMGNLLRKARCFDLGKEDSVSLFVVSLILWITEVAHKLVVQSCS